MIAMVRQLLGFGVTVLADPECERLAVILNKLHFEIPKSRAERLTAQQVIDIRAVAHNKNRHSIALAQAFQFDAELWQKDVIGEWLPITEPGDAKGVERDNKKWLFGIRWEEIDDNLILRHTQSIDFKEIERDLKRAPMVLEEFKKIYGLDVEQGIDRSKLPTKGPIVVAEFSDMPWSDHEYRRVWRTIATAAGVPKTVRNMDSRERTTSQNKPIVPEWTGRTPETKEAAN